MNCEPVTETYRATGGTGGFSACKALCDRPFGPQTHIRADSAKNPPVPPVPHGSPLDQSGLADHARAWLPCPADVIERAALIEAGDGIARELAEVRALAEFGFPSWSALATAYTAQITPALDALPPPIDATAARLLEASRRFLTGPHWPHCVALGWPLADVFGAHEWQPLERSQSLGLVPRAVRAVKAGRRLERITETGAEFRDADGRTTRFRRPSLELELRSVVPWWACPAIVSREDAA